MTATRFLLCVLILGCSLAASAQGPTTNPAVLIVNASYNPAIKGDFDCLQQLHQRGVLIDIYFRNKAPLNWDRIQKYNCLVFLDLSAPKENAAEMQALLDR